MSRRQDVKPRRFWSQPDLERLAEIYPSRPNSEVARLLDRTILSIYQTAYKLGLEKSREAYEWLRKGQSQPGTERGRFKKGHVPANTGLRRPGWHSGRMKETQFKKGVRSGIAAKNWQPIGTIMPDAEGYLRIKVREAVHGKEATGQGNPKVWPMYNRYLWEQHKGPIPPKHVVVFKDGNRQNCAIENLDLISMADNCRRNSIWNRMPRELAEAIQLNGALKRRIRRLNGKEQDQRP